MPPRPVPYTSAQVVIWSAREGGGALVKRSIVFLRTTSCSDLFIKRIRRKTGTADNLPGPESLQTFPNRDIRLRQLGALVPLFQIHLCSALFSFWFIHNFIKLFALVFVWLRRRGTWTGGELLLSFSYSSTLDGQGQLRSRLRMQTIFSQVSSYSCGSRFKIAVKIYL